MILLRTLYCMLLGACIGSLTACSKTDLLSATPSSDMFIPSTLDNMQALLDKDAIMSETPVLGELSCDDYYLLDNYWSALTGREQNGYIWAKEIFGSQEEVPDWSISYQQVFYANVVLEGLVKIPVNGQNEQQYNAIKGAALFIRGYAFYNVAQVFAPVYDSKSLDANMGIPLRLASGIDDISARSTLRQTYDRILLDLTDAAALLPATMDFTHRNRPSKAAGMAMLARAYLSMRMYDRSRAYADSSLQLYNTLIDYNKIPASASIPFSKLNDETLYQSRLLSTSNVIKGRSIPACIVDTMLYRSYDTADLRRSLFYVTNTAGLINVRSSYTGTTFAFSGLATDEIYLIRAESQARLGNTGASMEDLNTLLQTRWKTGTFKPLTAISANAALQLILAERRKELAFRGLRWTDIRRLNKDSAQITLTRLISGTSYYLPPNDPRYVLPIPPDVISLSGMVQNLR